jgi:hypothetical protein
MRSTSSLEVVARGRLVQRGFELGGHGARRSVTLGLVVHDQGVRGSRGGRSCQLEPALLDQRGHLGARGGTGRRGAARYVLEHAASRPGAFDGSRCGGRDLRSGALSPNGVVDGKLGCRLRGQVALLEEPGNRADANRIAADARQRTLG